MTSDETDLMLEMMGHIWPNSNVPTEHIIRWRSHFATIGLDVAIEIVERLEKETDFWPTWSQFHKHLYSAQMMLPEVKKPTFNPVTPEERANVARLIVEMKDALKVSGVGSHWHGGPAPCPVCGGLNPDIAWARRDEISP